MKYALLSLRWTHKNDDFITFWRHDAKGYCWFKAWMGRYSIVRSAQHSSDRTKRVSFEVLEPFWQEVSYEGKIRYVIPNTAEVREVMGIKSEDFQREYPS
ncbi:MAG: hypothetical protein CL666_14600 [Balneola sp.]|nr:hypothetical protein [Balneola sp.]|tara:strand:+ start:57999 stop:58298 length:300 start_codon:yes stop_codon:yes gene_type:complete